MISAILKVRMVMQCMIGLINLWNFKVTILSVPSIRAITIKRIDCCWYPCCRSLFRYRSKCNSSCRWRWSWIRRTRGFQDNRTCWSKSVSDLWMLSLSWYEPAIWLIPLITIVHAGSSTKQCKWMCYNPIRLMSTWSILHCHCYFFLLFLLCMRGLLLSIIVRKRW